jgi:hypothetical protein
MCLFLPCLNADKVVQLSSELHRLSDLIKFGLFSYQTTGLNSRILNSTYWDITVREATMLLT